jgi:hypothetical protein
MRIAASALFLLSILCSCEPKRRLGGVGDHALPQEKLQSIAQDYIQGHFPDKQFRIVEIKSITFQETQYTFQSGSLRKVIILDNETGNIRM